MRQELDSALWERLSDAFHDASELAPSERAAFLDRACAGAPEVRREVEAMLAVHDDNSALRVEERLFWVALAPDAVERKFGLPRNRRAAIDRHAVALCCHVRK